MFQYFYCYLVASIPGKYAPSTAGKTLAKTIQRIMGDITSDFERCV